MRQKGERIERSTRPPETMQPGETMESSATPTRPGSACAKTNFGGGAVIGIVRISQSLSYRLSSGVTWTRSRFAA